MRLIDADYLKGGFEEDGHLSPYIEEFIDACPTIATELQHNCDQNRVLTLDEVKDYISNGFDAPSLYVEFKDEVDNDFSPHWRSPRQLLTLTNSKVHIYGETWRCWLWLCEPTDKERAAVPWEV